MKLCYFYSDITLKGGIERVLSLLTTEQAKNPNLEISIVSQYKSFDRPHYTFPSQVRMVYLSEEPFGGAPRSLHRIRLLLKNRKNIRRFFKENHFDRIAAQAFPNAFMLYISGVDRRKIVAVEHTFYGYYGRFVRGLRIWLYKRLRSVVTLTGKDRDSFYRHLSSVYAIPNPVVLENRFQSSLDSKKIISIGRLEYEKGYDTLIRVWKELHDKYPDWSVEIYGEGTQQETLKKQIEDCGISDSLHLEGTTNNVLEKIRESAFFIMSSRFEGFGMVLVESMSQGVPCVSFDCPNGPSCIISDGEDGLLVKDQDEEALRTSMERLMNDIELRKRLGTAAYKKVENFEIGKIIRLWDILYARLKAGNK